jgi:hypothetical protein
MCTCYAIHGNKKHRMHHQVYMFDELIGCNNINRMIFSPITYIKNDLRNKVWINE